MKSRYGIILFFLITLFILISLTACEEQILWVGNNIPGHMSAEYASFTGTETQSMKLVEGDSVTLEYDSKVSKGTLTIKIIDPENKTFLELDPNKEDRMTFKAEKSGRYILSVRGDKTGGSYDIKWEKK